MILYPTYFSPIAHYVSIVKANTIIFETNDNYQKQTYRTRCYIYGADGKQLLNIPIKHNHNSKKTKDIKIDSSYNWSKQHIKALQMAYRSSPYFEYYEEDILAIFNNIPNYLLDFNFTCQEVILDLLQIKIAYSITNEYIKSYASDDFRFLVEAKSNRDYYFDSYIQVFSAKHGFIENLSILDLLFMEGPNALNYLENQIINLN